MALNMGVYGRRRIRNRTMMALSIIAAALGLCVLAAILWTLLYNGLGAIRPSIFTEPTPAPGSEGGLANAIFGSVVMTVVATLIGAPVGVLAGTFLAEYARGPGWARPSSS